MNEYAHYDGKAHKLLSDNRAAYFAQSARTKTGRAADFVAQKYAREQQPSSEYESELREGFSLKYG